MRPFRYETATDTAGAVAMVATEPDAMFLAGGTNLVDLMKLGVEAPALVVDVSRLPLDTIERTADGGLRIGAAVRNSDLAAALTVRREYPMLARALLAGASGQLRNAATVGGNLLQRTRCLYFQDVTKPCNKRVNGSGCPARTGDHRNLAILGASVSCVATHPSDMAVALVALDALVHVERPDGPRVIALDDFYVPPGTDPTRETVLRHGDLVTAIEIPPLPMARTSTYRKVRDRASYAFVVASIAAAIDVVDGEIRDARVALGAVAPQPWRGRRIEQRLVGGPPTDEHFRAAADAELAAAVPLRDNVFKVPLVRNLVARVLTELTEPISANGDGT